MHYGVLIRKIASSFSVLSSRIPAASGGERERKEWGKARANTRIGRRGSDPFLKIYVKQDGAFPPSSSVFASMAASSLLPVQYLDSLSLLERKT